MGGHQGLEGEGQWRVTATRHGVSVQGDETVLYMDSGDGDTV